MTFTGKQFQKIRNDLDLSQDEFALELGLIGNPRTNHTTIRRFEKEERPIPLPIARLAWLLWVIKDAPTWPTELVEQPHETGPDNGRQ